MSLHKIKLLKLMKEQGEITAGQVYGISNANQYLVELYHAGIVDFRWVKKNHSRFKMWRIIDYVKADRVLGLRCRGV
ncbi:hypothetical protein [Campylobacter sp. RM15925]|uniref:hypothetical protein n=1 Tax=Campylobacter sp. RM15925 TaxID=1705724 RepID=UPI00201E213D|nr:hypothetical protein [Campylobacter sp. RM15925]